MSQPASGRGTSLEPVNGLPPPRPAVVNVSARGAADPSLEHTAVLRRLIDEAGDAGTALETLLDGCRRGEGLSARAIARLQDRLRVGACLIQALAVQVEQAREVARDLERNHADLRRTEEHLADMMARAQRLVDAVESAEVNIAVVAHRAAVAARGG